MKGDEREDLFNVKSLGNSCIYLLNHFRMVLKYKFNNNIMVF